MAKGSAPSPSNTEMSCCWCRVFRYRMTTTIRIHSFVGSCSRMNAIEKIAAILKQYPGVRYEFRADAIRALAPDENGYEVALLMYPQPQYTVCLATWHMEFTNEDDAIGTFLGGLSEAYRLEVTSRGDV